MKIVLNTHFGGFGLSNEAIQLYSELSGIKLIKEIDNRDYPNSIFWKFENGEYFFDFNLERNDPNLIKVVEQMGEDSFGSYAQLEIVEIPDNIPWEIDSYDGSECVKSYGEVI